jgi:uncharacterized protein (TIGR00730 family)
MPVKRVCVYCGSSSGALEEYAGAARSLGAAIARRGLGLVYGGGRVGLMGAVADAAAQNGGEVIGVITHALVKFEVAHHGLKDLRVVDTMHQRKALMAELSDAFIAMPGGFGTLEEVAEVITWTQLGIHEKPVGLLNTAAYYDPLLAFFDRAVEQKFVRAALRSSIVTSGDVEELLERVVNAGEPGMVKKWINGNGG